MNRYAIFIGEESYRFKFGKIYKIDKKRHGTTLNGKYIALYEDIKIQNISNFTIDIPSWLVYEKDVIFLKND